MKNRGKELFNKLYQDTQLTETEYKELLDMGIISKEEFEKKKKELLNL